MCQEFLCTRLYSDQLLRTYDFLLSVSYTLNPLETGNLGIMVLFKCMIQA